jgi:hypothetical protein
MTWNRWCIGNIERCIFAGFYEDLKGKIRKHRSGGSLIIYEALRFQVLEFLELEKTMLQNIRFTFHGSTKVLFYSPIPGPISCQKIRDTSPFKHLLQAFVRVAEASEPCSELLNEWELTCRVKKLVIDRISHEVSTSTNFKP